jgi:phosphatidate cytidylyltransferase
MFWQRAAVALTLGPLTLLLVYWGGWPYTLAFGALLAIGVLEYSQMMSRLGWRAPVWLLLPAAAAQWILPASVLPMLFPGAPSRPEYLGLATLMSLLAMLGYALWLYEKRPQDNAAGSLLALFTGLLLLGWLASHFFRLRGIGDSPVEWTALALVATWFADSGGYVFGKTLGRRKLAPRLSPNKTVEGYLGGIVLGVLSMLLVGLFLELDPRLLLAVGLLIAVLGTAGDLGISLFKRSVGVKDSGHMLPGHGGALDRTDSLIWSVAITYYVLAAVG